MNTLETILDKIENKYLLWSAYLMRLPDQKRNTKDDTYDGEVWRRGTGR